jgi:disulfide oxidoreductase YuzD
LQQAVLPSSPAWQSLPACRPYSCRRRFDCGRSGGCVHGAAKAVVDRDAIQMSLTLGQQAAKNVADELERAEMSEFYAKDIFRASKLSLLGVSNSHVEKDRAKIIRHEKLSPLLLFRDKNNGMLVIADGYHRLCAVYTFDEDAMIPCKIV